MSKSVKNALCKDYVQYNFNKLVRSLYYPVPENLDYFTTISPSFTKFKVSYVIQ